MNENVLVTGGAGFIGKHLVDRLLAEGSAVTVVDLKDPSLAAPKELGLDSQCHYRQMSVYWSGFGQLLLDSAFDEIYWLAGCGSVSKANENPIQVFEDEVCSVVWAIRELAGSGRPRPTFVYVSSGAVYGATGGVITERSPTVPISTYGVTKLAAELWVRELCEHYNIKHVILRLFSTYGPGQRKQVVYDLISRLHRDPKQLAVYAPKIVTRDFVYVTDAVGAILTAARHGRMDVYNIASGKSHTLGQLVERLCEIMEIDPSVSYARVLPSDHPAGWFVSIDWIAKDTGWTPTVLFKDGLVETVEWYRKEVVV